MKIRKAKLTDAKCIADIYSHHILSGESCMNTEVISSNEIVKNLQRLNDREIYAVIELEGKVVAWANLKQYSPRPGYRFCCESSVYISPNHMGQGLGLKIMHWILDKALDLNYHHIVAKILAKNQSSIRFHEKLGYTTVGRQSEIGLLNGQWEDVIIMQKLMDNDKK